MTNKGLNNFAHYYRVIWGISSIIIAFVGCTVSQSNVLEYESTIASEQIASEGEAMVVSPSATTALLETLENTPVVTSTPGIVPKQTSTEIALPTDTKTATAIPTATPTPAPTLTPLPTIPPQQVGEIFNDFMKNNGNCVLPCWWGFEVGKTPIEHIEQLYTSLGASITKRNYADNKSRLTALFVDPQIEDGIQVRHMFHAQNDILTEAEIQLNILPNYQIEPILKQLGQPSEIWMWTIPESFEGFLPADFLLYFPEHGVLIGYQTDATKDESFINVCFDKQGAGTLFLWDPNDDKEFAERANESSELTLEGHRPLAEVSNWDIKKFYTVLTDPAHTECLETPSELWTSP